jgi:hypothetical protein
LGEPLVRPVAALSAMPEWMNRARAAGPS